jgi:hypothetical protein
MSAQTLPWALRPARSEVAAHQVDQRERTPAAAEFHLILSLLSRGEIVAPAAVGFSLEAPFPQGGDAASGNFF